MIDRKCIVCGKEFKMHPCRLKEKGRGKYCSRECFKFDQGKRFTMEGNPNWKGGRKRHQGYVKIRVSKGVYQFEHRLVMEKLIGRKLLKEEYVHHINGIKDDNRIENLVVCRGKEHVKKHNKDRHSCPTCGKFMSDGLWKKCEDRKGQLV